MDFYEHLEKYLNKKQIASLKNSLEGKDFHAVLLNTNKMSDETFLSLYPNCKPHPFVKHGYYFDKEEYQLGKSIYHDLGCFYIQEPSAMIVSSLLDFSYDDLILDMCAAPGGKTIQCALKNAENGLIIANDLSKSRCFELANNIERLGLGNVVVTNNDLALIYDRYINTFDKIILDAPCSGSGMFRKESKMMEDWSINKVYKFAELQKDLLKIAYRMLKPGGIISYSTCSFSYEEDEEVIESLLESSDAQVIESIDSPYLLKGKYGFHLLPNMFEGEGHYICQIKKPGSITKTRFNTNKNTFIKYLPTTYQNWNINKYGDYLFGLPHSIDFKGFNVVKYGVKFGELNKDVFKFDIHLAHHIKDGLPIIELNEKEVKSYLTGNQLYKENNCKGYVLLKYKNINVDIGKSDTRVIKNHYPKGLRKQYN